MKYDWDKEHWENTMHLWDGTILKAYVQVKLENNIGVPKLQKKNCSLSKCSYSNCL